MNQRDPKVDHRNVIVVIVDHDPLDIEIETDGTEIVTESLDQGQGRDEEGKQSFLFQFFFNL